MEHKSVKQKLIFYLEGSLAQEEMNQLEAHLKKCADCRLFLDDLKQSLQVLNNDNTVEVSPYFYSKVKTKLQKEHVSFFERYSRILQPAFFVLILAVGVNFGIWMGNAYSDTTNSQYQETGLLSFDDMSQEPIEQFLINFE